MACARGMTCLRRGVTFQLLAPGRCLRSPLAAMATAAHQRDQNSFKVLVIGGGSGGASTAAKFTNQFGRGKVAVIEPSDVHYYQPIWTLVGAGLKTLDESGRPMGEVLPRAATWIKDKAVTFDPDNNTVTTEGGRQIKYEFLVIGMGIQLNFHAVKGLEEALDRDPQVCSNYSPKYVNKTHEAMKQFKEGNAIFTFPNTPIKCPGAPQKIVYLTEEYFTKTGKRDKANILYNSSLGVLFGVKKYADSLWEVVKKRDIKVNLRRNLIEVKPDTKEAVFELLDSEKGETETYEYSMLHVAPPMSPPDILKKNPKLTDEAGWVDVHKESLQHTRYPNIFALGDCTNLPTSRTAAGVATQVGILKHNMSAYMNGADLKRKYDGYTSCPLITGYRKCILAEFDFNGQPLETFPFNQGREMMSMYHMKADAMPLLYWQMMTKGYWNGPKAFRKMMHLGMGR